ncbi:MULTISPECIES: YafY family protein [unclassified Lentimicrobium]|uniref:helix-turn-helix transcriptional regulator n=1 Tax=unclassified Lentimicrobium TaxID=2677434 RepID=UPI0015576B97|nr:MULTISPECIES: WYL domain-containing protein [unclassified Lentimicrobium]NPD47577.1 WYL domain-containing protein [Lentimicrobium sp. S6]NPD86916.1 WYL domain-containing protein [Lentimicrobium sp. L6]
MPNNKNAIIRYQALDKCLRNPGSKYSIKDLVDECNKALIDIDSTSTGVQKRQVYDDLKFMRDSKGYDAPITNFKDGRVVYYQYEDRSFTINKQPLNELEAQQLKESLHTLSRFSGLPQFEWIEDMKLRLDQYFKFESQEHIIEFDSNPYLKGREYIGQLYAAINNQKVLEISYRSFKSEHPEVIIIHPYFLKEYNNRWFLFGLDNKADYLPNLALDRMMNVEECNLEYIRNTKINFEEYFEDVIGVSVDTNNEIQKVILKVDVELWPYIQTKPLHGSQKIVEHGSEYVMISIEIKRNYELESLILSFGDKIELMEPALFRHDLLNRIERLREKYK